MIQKLVVAITSSITLCLILTVLQYTPVQERDIDTYYFSFSGLMFIYLIYATPVFVMGGIPCSIIIDKMNQKISVSSKLLRYGINVCMYALAGVITGSVFFMIITGGIELEGGSFFTSIMILSALASLLFYHITLITGKVFFKVRD